MAALRVVFSFKAWRQHPGLRAGTPLGGASGGKALLPSPQRRALSLLGRMFRVASSQAELVHQLKAEGVVKHRHAWAGRVLLLTNAAAAD